MPKCDIAINNVFDIYVILIKKLTENTQIVKYNVNNFNVYSTNLKICKFTLRLIIQIKLSSINLRYLVTVYKHIRKHIVNVFLHTLMISPPMLSAVEHIISTI